MPEHIEGFDLADEVETNVRDLERAPAPGGDYVVDDFPPPMPDPEELPGRAERIASQAEMIALAREQGIDGEFCKRLEAGLIRYARPVLLSWVRSGYIFTRVRKIKLKKGNPDLHPTDVELEMLARDQQLREDLVQETLIRALLTFRRQLDDPVEGWQPDGGADLQTYFVTNCLLRFISVFQSHRTTNGRDAKARYKLVADFIANGEASPRSVESDVLGNNQVAHVLKDLSDRDQRILAAYVLGFTFKEIAEMYLDVANAGVARAVMHRLRQRHSLIDRLEGMEDSK